MANMIGKWATLIGLGAIVGLAACNSGEQQQAAPLQPAPQQSVTPPQQIAPVQPTPVAEAPATPPATPLTPVGDAVESAPEKTPPKKSAGGTASIDKKLPGTATSGDELLGAYTCRIDSKKLQIGPIKLPPFGCKIFKAGDGTLKIGSTSDGAGSIKGNVTDQTVAGFFISGKFEMSGNSLAIKARMATKGVGSYAGSGRGRLNDDKSAQITYKLTMTKK